MNEEMAYLLGMILGNGEIQQNPTVTTVTIDIPHKNLKTDDGMDVDVYVTASLFDIQQILEPLLNQHLTPAQSPHSTQISFSRPNNEHVMREIIHFIGAGTQHATMHMNEDLFLITRDQKRALLRGIADVTGYIRKSNAAYGRHPRVYIEIPRNWYMVIDIANMLKSVDVPIQTIDFGHPNFRDANLRMYNNGNPNFWKKEHQIKIYANEFLPIGFNVRHKQRALETYAAELLEELSPESTHSFYWEKNIRRRHKPVHPGETDNFLPQEIRGMHFDSWTELAELLGYGR